jgi:2-iminobutanoate/2-iminopropanoate deaminase
MGFERLIFVSGQGATDPATGQLAGADVETQTEQCLKNLQAILEAGGSNLQHVLRCGVFLIDIAGIPEDERGLLAHVRRASPGAHDHSGGRPARDGLRVEIDCIAYVP